MKSTKAIETTHGTIVQITTQQRNPDGSYSIAEALVYAPEKFHLIKIKNNTYRLCDVFGE